MGSQDHFDVDINIDPYLGAQIEVLEGDFMGDHFHVVESDGQFQKGYPPLGDGVENISTRNSRLNVSLLEYQQEQVADCFMGVVEEKVSSGPTRWRLTHRNVGDDPHMDQMELDSNWQRQNAIDVDRERKFIRGWEDIKRKIVIMNNRIGTRTSVHAVFQNSIYFMDTNRPKANQEHQEMDVVQGDEVSDSEVTKESSVVERDHRYAAVILTQKKSSSDVRDHQYNQVSSNNCSDPQNLSTTFIKSRYKREQQLVKYLDSLFSKKQNLEAVTGANITLEVSYEHCVFNPRNFETADATLSNNRKKLFRVPVVPTMEFSGSDEGLENYDPNLPRILMRVERVPAGGDITPGIHIRYVKRNSDDRAGTILRTSPQKDELNPEKSLTPISIRVEPEFLSLDHPYGLSPSIMSSSPNAENISTIAKNKNYLESSQDEDYDHCFEDNNQLDQESMLTSQSKTLASTSTTQTQPICGICGVIGSQNNSNLTSSEMWLRCFNPFCHFMIHPTCLGFRISSTTELMKLPPYLCPEHR